ncbi:MAG: TlpA family protein disulfide reductase [Pirellulaceae bacterium]|nr:TlpA family protein disulfide reductase [Pirellulaceae bacterium]
MASNASSPALSQTPSPEPKSKSQESRPLQPVNGQPPLVDLSQFVGTPLEEYQTAKQEKNQRLKDDPSNTQLVEQASFTRTDQNNIQKSFEELLLVPEGSPLDLLAFCKRTEGLTPRGQVGSETWKMDLEKICIAIITAAEDVLNQKEDQPARLKAAHYKMSALGRLIEQKNMQAKVHFSQYTKALSDDQNLQLARLGHTAQVLLHLDQLEQQQHTNTEPLFKHLKKILAYDDLTVSEAGLCWQAAQILDHLEQPDQALVLYETALPIFETKDLVSTDALSEMQSHQYFLKTNYTTFLEQGLRGDEYSKEKVIALLEDYFQSHKPTRHYFDTSFYGANLFELTGDSQTALKLFSILQKQFSKQETTPALYKLAQINSKAGLTRNQLIGQPFELTANSLNQKPFSTKQLLGKVTLVYFWSTTSPNSLHEFPALHELHEKYSSDNFEIIGVNFDRQKLAVDDFFTTQDLPWKTYLTYDQKGTGNLPDLAEEFGISHLPFAILLDRHGNISHIHTVGDTLTSLLEKKFSKK